MIMKYTKKKLLTLSFAWTSVALLVFGYGLAVGLLKIFPFQAIVSAWEGAGELAIRCEMTLPEYYSPVKRPPPAAIYNTSQAYQGLNLVVGVVTDHKLCVKIMDMDGHTLHKWDIDWFKIWPDAKHVPERLIPRSRPGTMINQAMIMRNGDLVFIFGDIGLVRINPRGKVVWRLPYQTHHSIEQGDNGDLWVCCHKEHTKPSKLFPHRVPPYPEAMILVVSPDGQIKQQWSVAELLRKNGLGGLLYLGSRAKKSTQIRGNILHMNDVDPFPAQRLKEGFFTQGDVLVSLRDINTVFVFNRITEKIKFVSTGKFIRQHDPNFIDGNTFSVFDNIYEVSGKKRYQSRIAIVSAPENTVKTYFAGTREQPFFTEIMGKHQWLPNGNMLITESCEGRAFEINPSGEIVWQYVNYVGEGVIGRLNAVNRLPPDCPRVHRAIRREGDEQDEIK